MFRLIGDALKAFAVGYGLISIGVATTMANVPKETQLELRATIAATVLWPIAIHMFLEEVE